MTVLAYWCVDAFFISLQPLYKFELYLTETSSQRLLWTLFVRPHINKKNRNCPNKTKHYTPPPAPPPLAASTPKTAAECTQVWNDGYIEENLTQFWWLAPIKMHIAQDYCTLMDHQLWAWPWVTLWSSVTLLFEVTSKSYSLVKAVCILTLEIWP